MIKPYRKILVTGAGGMLGHAIREVFSKDYSLYFTDIDLHSSWLIELDVRKYGQAKNVIESFHPDLVLHLAALTDLEFCETYPRYANETNARGTENIANICNQLSIPMIYISTAGVFDGTKSSYSELDEPNPINVYGKSKYDGEKIVKKILKNYFIFRAGWMMGGGPNFDKKFVNKIIKQINLGKKELQVVSDRFGCPTYTYDFASNMKAMIETEEFGLYHMVGEGRASRFDVAIEMINILGLKDKISITPVTSLELKKEYFAERPISEQLENRNLKLIGMSQMRNWHKTLQEYLSSSKWLK